MALQDDEEAAKKLQEAEDEMPPEEEGADGLPEGMEMDVEGVDGMPEMPEGGCLVAEAPDQKAVIFSKHRGAHALRNRTLRLLFPD